MMAMSIVPAMAQLFDVKLQCKPSSSNTQPSHFQNHGEKDDDGIYKPLTRSCRSPAPSYYTSTATEAMEGTGK